MDCQICEIRSAEGYCVSCQKMLCGECAEVCHHCGKWMCPEHIHQSRHGNAYCVPCAKERKHRQKEQVRKREKEEREQRHLQDTSFAALTGEDVADMPEHGFVVPDEEERPVFVASGYQPPSRLTYLVVMVGFSLVAIVLWRVMPDPGSILWPFNIGGARYTEGLMAPVQDTNALRNTSNIALLDIVFNFIVFLVAWTIVLAYLFGWGALLYGLIREGYYWVLARDVENQQEKT